MPEKNPTPPSHPTAVSLYDCAIEAMAKLERAKALIGIIQSAMRARSNDQIGDPYYEISLSLEVIEGCFERTTSRVSELLWHERVQAEGARQ
jgi:hypothetical protein